MISLPPSVAGGDHDSVIATRSVAAVAVMAPRVLGRPAIRIWLDQPLSPAPFAARTWYSKPVRSFGLLRLTEVDVEPVEAAASQSEAPIARRRYS